MNDFDFDSQLKRLAAVCPKTWDDDDKTKRTRLVDELRPKFRWYDADRWAAIVGRVIETHDDPKRIPLVKAFVDADRWVKDHEPMDGTKAEMTPEQNRQWVEDASVRMGPKGAKYALKLEAESPVKLPPHIHQLLTEIAAAEAPADAVRQVASMDPAQNDARRREVLSVAERLGVVPMA